jgi:hypothetical protein
MQCVVLKTGDLITAFQYRGKAFDELPDWVKLWVTAIPRSDRAPYGLTAAECPLLEGDCFISHRQFVEHVTGDVVRLELLIVG